MGGPPSGQKTPKGVIWGVSARGTAWGGCGVCPRAAASQPWGPGLGTVGGCSALCQVPLAAKIAK